MYPSHRRRTSIGLAVQPEQEGVFLIVLSPCAEPCRPPYRYGAALTFVTQYDIVLLQAVEELIGMKLEELKVLLVSLYRCPVECAVFRSVIER